LHVGNHVLPRRRPPTCTLAKASTIEPSVANEVFVRRNVDIESVYALDDLQQVELADRIPRNVPKAFQLRMIADQPRDQIRRRNRRQPAIESADKASDPAAPLGKEPVDQPQMS